MLELREIKPGQLKESIEQQKRVLSAD